MAVRSIKDVQLRPRAAREGQIVPSPFPLLILTLIIAVIFIFKVRADGDFGASSKWQEVRSALPNRFD